MKGRARVGGVFSYGRICVLVKRSAARDSCVRWINGYRLVAEVRIEEWVAVWVAVAGSLSCERIGRCAAALTFVLHA